MAQPTREQFDAAMQKVAQSAPPGLTKEQFYALVDQELIAVPAAQEPPTAGGAIENMVTGAREIAGSIPGLMLRAATQSPATTAEELAGGVLRRGAEYVKDIHPREALGRAMAGHPIEALSNLLPVEMMYRDPAAAAADVLAGGAVARGAKGVTSGGRRVTRGIERRYNAPEARARRTVREAMRREREGGPPVERPTVAPAPEFATTLEEANIGRTTAAVPNPEDVIYNAMIEKLGGRQPTARAPEFMRSIEDPEWHSGLDISTPEGRAAAGMHRYAGEMDQGYRRRIADERGIAAPDLITGAVLDEVARRFIKSPVIRGTLRNVPRPRLPRVGSAVHALEDIGVISRFMGEK